MVKERCIAMQLSKDTLQRRLSGLTPVQFYLILTAFCAFLGIAFGPFGSYAFEEMMVVPCVLFLGAMFPRQISSGAKRALRLSGLMLAWFAFLQIKRRLEYLEFYPFSPYFCAYLFAFPLAALLQDGEKKAGLKLFFTALVAASVSHAVTAVLLLLDLVPASLTEYHVFWDGSRLNSFWHPNMVACFLMFGIAACLAFLHSAKSKWAKLAMLAVILLLLSTMALTNCRTVIILTGGILGGSAFYSILRGRWKLAPIALVVACVILVLVYKGCGKLYEIHTDALTARQITEYLESEGLTLEDLEAMSEDFTLETTSAQKSLVEDLSSLNSRTVIWQSSFLALNANRANYLFGVENPGKHMSYFCYFSQTHTHNSWVETLLGLGVPGFVLAMVFTLLTLWNGIVILLKYPLDVWKRTTAMVTLCMLVASFMEPYLFLPPLDYYIYNFIFLLCAGYLVHWQEEDNRNMLTAVRKRLHI
ncbi:MAG: O-antigen ligase family protein [Oscillospiraceae bacterium]|nr:O-antigen ligase family protein [Oscillospiraceae bacterium]